MDACERTGRIVSTQSDTLLRWLEEPRRRRIRNEKRRKQAAKVNDSFLVYCNSGLVSVADPSIINYGDLQLNVETLPLFWPENNLG